MLNLYIVINALAPKKKPKHLSAAVRIDVGLMPKCIYLF